MKKIISAFIASALLGGMAYADSKNGVFIGVEGHLGEASTILSTTDGSDTIGLAGSSTTFDLGLLGGYQYYFGESQRHGIKVSAHLYSGFGNSWDYSVPNGTDFLTANLSFVPIKFGVDVKYAWDFLEAGEHTLGLNVGVGYAFSAYTNGKVSAQGQSVDLDTTLFANDVYPVLGLHYYYGHNQFEILYRGGGILTSTAKYETNLAKINLNSDSYFAFNYAYRF